MGVEIERKFLVCGDGWREVCGLGVEMVQGYVCVEEHVTLRVRVAGDRGWLTLKGRSVPGELARPEYEYEVPVGEARELLDRFSRYGCVWKRRYVVGVREGEKERLWEVDEFMGENAGLVLAEVELEEEGEEVVLPDWVGREVTGDGRYHNAYLARFPYGRWGGGV
jgi:CYTH domain-containing protein